MDESATDGGSAGATTDPLDRDHDASWSANLERERHADREQLLADAVTAVERTAPGHHVNLVTHGDHGHPSSYLFDRLAEAFGDEVRTEFVERCGCGGYVTRVHVER
jgi:putative CGCGG family rSAM target protein